MLCNECPLRHKCAEPCAELEQDLARHETYQREKTFDPGTLNYLAQKAGLQWADLFPGHPSLWEQFAGYLGALPRELLDTFLMYYHQNMTVGDIAANMNISRVTVYRRLNRSRKIILHEKQKPRRPESRQGLRG